MINMEEWKIEKVCRCSITFPTSELKQNQWIIYEPEKELVLQFSKISKVSTLREDKTVHEVFDFSSNLSCESIRVYKKGASLLFLKKLKDTLYKCRILFKGENGEEDCSKCYSVLKFYCADSSSNIGTHRGVKPSLNDEVLPVGDTERDAEDNSPSFLTECEVTGISSDSNNKIDNTSNDAEECVVVDIIPSSKKLPREPQQNINESEPLASPSTSGASTSAKSLIVKKKNQTRIIQSLFKSPSGMLRSRELATKNKRVEIRGKKPRSEEGISLTEGLARSRISHRPTGRKRGRKKKENNLLHNINNILKKCSLESQEEGMLDSPGTSSRERFLKTMFACCLLEPKLLEVASAVNTIIDTQQ